MKRIHQPKYLDKKIDLYDEFLTLHKYDPGPAKNYLSSEKVKSSFGRKTLTFHFSKLDCIQRNLCSKDHNRAPTEVKIQNEWFLVEEPEAEILYQFHCCKTSAEKKKWEYLVKNA